MEIDTYKTGSSLMILNRVFMGLGPWNTAYNFIYIHTRAMHSLEQNYRDIVNLLVLILSYIIDCSILATLIGPKSSRKTRLITLIDSVKLVNMICLPRESSTWHFYYPPKHSNFTTVFNLSVFAWAQWAQFFYNLFPS